MTPQELKNSILQRAIQGKLVEQRPEEGTAEELYQQIQAEKQALIKAKKIKKDKPLPEITDDEKPFDIPESWKWVRLSDVCSLISDGTHKTPHYVEKGVPFISVKDISSGVLDFSNTKYITEEEHNRLIQRCKPEQNDILVCRIGTLGKALKIDTQDEFSIFVSLGLIKLVFSAIADYVEVSINSGYGISWIQKVKVGGGTHTYKINLDDLRQYPFPLPPLAEQKRIVAKIEELLPLIDRYEQAWSKLEEFNKRFPGDMQKSLLQMAIQGKLVEQRPEEGTAEELYQQIQAEKQALIKAKKIKKDKPLPEITEDEKPFDIPDSWKWVRLIEVGSFSSGKTPTMGEAKYWDNGSVQWFTSKDMKKKYLDISELKITELAASEMKKYPAGTILMVVRSGILKRKLPLCILTRESTINQDIKAYQLFDLSISEYIYYMIKGLETHILKNYRKQVTTVDSLMFDEFSKKMLVPLPPLAEQKRIVEKLEELLPLCERLK